LVKKELLNTFYTILVGLWKTSLWGRLCMWRTALHKNLGSCGPSNCFHRHPSAWLTQLCLRSEHSQALMSCQNSAGSACCAGWGASCRTLLTQEGEDVQTDFLMGMACVHMLCSSIVLK